MKSVYLPTAVTGLLLITGCVAVETPVRTGPVAGVVTAAPAPQTIRIQPELSAAAGPVTPVNAPRGRAVGHLGDYLITLVGRTLYTYASDPKERSVCTGSCAQLFPPYLVSDGGRAGGGATIITRPDGLRQWARNGQPLYVYSGDAQLRDRNGASIPGWRVAPYF